MYVWTYMNIYVNVIPHRDRQTYINPTTHTNAHNIAHARCAHAHTSVVHLCMSWGACMPCTHNQHDDVHAHIVCFCAFVYRLGARPALSSTPRPRSTTASKLIYIYVYVYMCICVCLFTHMNQPRDLARLLQVSLYTCMYPVCVWVYTNACMHTYIHTYMIDAIAHT